MWLIVLNGIYGQTIILCLHSVHQSGSFVKIVSKQFAMLDKQMDMVKKCKFARFNTC